MTTKTEDPYWARRHGRLLLVAALLLVAVFLLLLYVGGDRGLLFFRQDTTWQQMTQRGVWRVGMDPSFPPFEFLDDGGKPVGYDVDLATQMAQEWGMEVEIVAIGFDSLIDALQAGKIDSVVSALPHDPRLTKDIAYSEPYFEAGIRLVVADDATIETAEALAGKTVAVEWGSMGDMVGRRLQREEIPVALAQFPTPQDAVDALTIAKTVDALLIDNITLRQAQGDGAAIRAVGPALESNPYVIAMPVRAADLHARVAEALTTLKENGSMNALEARWFGRHSSSAGERVPAEAKGTIAIQVPCTAQCDPQLTLPLEYHAKNPAVLPLAKLSIAAGIH